MLINSNNVWIWGIIQIYKTFAKNMEDLIFTLDVLQFFNNDKKSWVHID